MDALERECAAAHRRRVTAVHQAVVGAGPYDAVSEQIRAWRRLLTGPGTRAATMRARSAPGASDASTRWSASIPAPAT